MKAGNILNKLYIWANWLTRRLQLKSIQVIIAGSFAILTITCMLAVGIILYDRFSRAAETNAIINAQQIIDQIKINLDSYIEEMLDISDYVNFKIYMQEDFCDDFSGFLGDIIKPRDDITSLAVFSENGELLASSPYSGYFEREVTSQSRWFRLAIENPGRLFFSSPRIRESKLSQDERILSLSRSTNFYRFDQGIGGVLLVEMNFNAIDDMFRRVSLGKKGYIVILDSFGHVIYRPRYRPMLDMFNLNKILRGGDQHFIQYINGDRAIITINTINHAEWRIVGISYIDELIATGKDIRNFALWILFASLLFTVVVSVFISHKISRPIKMLENSMKKVSNGDFNVIADIKGDNEVENLSKTYNIMLTTIRNLMDQIVLDQTAMRKSEFNALQSQIQPHFLYNTLDSILWLAEKENNSEVVAMVTALSKFFRLSLSNGKNIITLADEIEHVRNYLIIQKNRYKDKFTYIIEANCDTLQCKIPKLLLQPIVENAIYHGIQSIVDEGEIRISSLISSGKLLIQVQDNGLGMSGEKLESVIKEISVSAKSTGIGLKNVNERIKLHFGAEYGLEFLSEQDKGTLVKMWLPIIYEESQLQ